MQQIEHLYYKKSNSSILSNLFWISFSYLSSLGISFVLRFWELSIPSKENKQATNWTTQVQITTQFIQDVTRLKGKFELEHGR